MPMYDYKCLDCGKEVVLSLRLQDHERGSVACPSCNGNHYELLGNDTAVGCSVCNLAIPLGRLGKSVADWLQRAYFAFDGFRVGRKTPVSRPTSRTSAHGCWS